MKTTKLIFLLPLFICSLASVYGQGDTDTVNTTSKCLRISRTSTNWQELIAFSVTPFTVPANTTKYLYMMVLYPSQPDIAIRVDGEDENSDGDTTKAIRPLNSYTNFGKWGTLVFPLTAESTDMQVNAILIFPDAGFENEPQGQVLNNSGAFGYIDEIILKDNLTLTNANLHEELNAKNDILVYPNPSQKIVKIETETTITKVSLYNSLGKEIIQKMKKVDENNYDIGRLSSGLYFIHIFDDKGGIAIKRLLKQ